MNTDPKFSEKEFDAEIIKLIHNHGQEKAPAFFTEKVMSRVREEKIATGYKPVISIRAWVWIGFFVLAVTGYTLTQPASSAKVPFTLPEFFTPPLFESINHWFASLTSGSWQMIHTSGLLLPLFALFLALSLHFILLNGFDNSRKNRFDKMYCF